MFSGGKASWLTAHRVAEAYPGADITLFDWGGCGCMTEYETAVDLVESHEEHV